LMNFSILFSGAYSFFNSEIFDAFLFVFLMKILIDLPVLVSFTGFAQRKNLLWFYIPLQILYVIYVSLIGIAGNILSYRWKGRRTT
jgi:hypothetical protein